MALSSLDDRLLGEKVNNYCSSSEDEDEQNSNSEEETTKKVAVKPPRFIRSNSSADGRTAQTGPKGVIEDWRRFKQLETEKREKDQQEKNQLCKKLAMTCKSFKEEQEAKGEKVDSDLSEDDDFMEWYKQKRIQEMQQKFASKWSAVVFGRVFELDRNNFVEAIENEKKAITVIIHIYDDETPACSAVNGCMRVLASKYKAVKFCRMKASEAKVSANFMENGLPSIIVYKDNMVIGNFVRISDTLGEDFFAPEFEAFLLEYGMLPLQHEMLVGR